MLYGTFAEKINLISSASLILLLSFSQSEVHAKSSEPSKAEVPTVVGCKEFVSNYEIAKKHFDNLIPSLFKSDVKFDKFDPELPQTPDQVRIDNVKDGTGYIQCKRDGTIDTINIELSGNPKDQFVLLRQSLILQSLIVALKPENYKWADKTLKKLLSDAKTDLLRSRTRGDEYVIGRSDVEVENNITLNLSFENAVFNLTIDRSMAEDKKPPLTKAEIEALPKIEPEKTKYFSVTPSELITNLNNQMTKNGFQPYHLVNKISGDKASTDVYEVGSRNMLYIVELKETKKVRDYSVIIATGTSDDNVAVGLAAFGSALDGIPPGISSGTKAEIANDLARKTIKMQVPYKYEGANFKLDCVPLAGIMCAFSPN